MDQNYSIKHKISPVLWTKTLMDQNFSIGTKFHLDQNLFREQKPQWIKTFPWLQQDSIISRNSAVENPLEAHNHNHLSLLKYKCQKMYQYIRHWKLNTQLRRSIVLSFSHLVSFVGIRVSSANVVSLSSSLQKQLMLFVMLCLKVIFVVNWKIKFKHSLMANALYLVSSRVYKEHNSRWYK